jgi:hypothetical protein
MGSAEKRLVAVFFLAHLLLSAYFSYYRPNANATSRALSVVSLVEQGSLDITAHQSQTRDKALIDGRYYSDKAPLPTLIVAPFYALLHSAGVVPAVGTRFDRARAVFVLGGFLCGALPLAALVTLTFVSLLRLDPRSKIPRTLLASLPFYGSFLFVYAAVFYAHLVAALLLLLSWIAIRAPGGATPSLRRDAAAGGLVGLAVLAEYPAAVVLPAWIAHLLRFRAERLRSVGAFVFGGLPFLALLLLYNALLTGSPFHFAYEFEPEPGFEAMQQALGLRVPSPSGFAEALWGLLVSPFRGLAVYAPVSVLLALVRLRDVGRRLLGHSLVHAAALYLGLIACYYMWWGGWAYGPRHLIPPVALLFFAGAGVLARARFWVPAFYGLCGLGLVFALAAKATVGIDLRAAFRAPLWEVVIPDALAGRFSPYNLASLWLGVRPAVAIALWPCLFALVQVGLVRYERRVLPLR